MGSGEGIFWF